jgi:hypothetical protein
MASASWLICIWFQRFSSAMIFVSSPSAFGKFCARGKAESTSRKMRGRNITVAPLGRVFFPRMPPIKLLVAREFPRVLLSDKRVAASSSRSRPANLSVARV